MYFVSTFNPKYRIGNEFDYDPKLNNLFHYGLDFAHFIIEVENKNNSFFFFNETKPNKISNTRSFDFSNGTVNEDVNILQYSNKRIIRTTITTE
jgi:UDP-3-O-acyl-N-acetylglucosamine deacetylase